MPDQLIRDLRAVRPERYYHQLSAVEATNYQIFIESLTSDDLRSELRTCDHRGRQDIAIRELAQRQ